MGATPQGAGVSDSGAKLASSVSIGPLARGPGSRLVRSAGETFDGRKRRILDSVAVKSGCQKRYEGQNALSLLRDPSPIRRSGTSSDPASSGLRVGGGRWVSA